ncbi:hypothetical protein KKB18_00090, partial [bacterium]|nr:hypothetical protein [bacterium]
MILKDSKVKGNNNKDLKLFMLLMIFGVFLSTSLVYADNDFIGNKKVDFKSDILKLSALIASGDSRITELAQTGEIPEINSYNSNNSMFRDELLDYTLDTLITIPSESKKSSQDILELIANRENLHNITSRILRNNSGTIQTIPFDSIPLSFDASVYENLENIKYFAKNTSLTPLEYKTGWDMQNMNENIILTDSIVYNVTSIMATWEKYLAQQDKGLVINIEVDKEIYNPDETGEASISIVNSGASISGDFLLALIDPKTNIYFYPIWSDNIRIFPVQIPGNFELDKIKFVEFKMPNEMPPIEKPGKYTFAGGLSTTGTYNFISTGVFDFTANTPPNAPYSPNGPSKGWINTPYTFKTLSIDESHDMLSIKFDWGDGTLSDWTEFMESGKPLSMVHSFNSTGTFDIRAMAQDVWSAQSNWSKALRITIIDTLPPETPTLEGPTEGQILKEYFFKVKTTDPDEDMITYKVDWGDGASDGWSEYLNKLYTFI